MFTTLIDCRTLAALEAAERVIVDARFSLADKGAGRRDYLAGHLPGAVFADLEQDLSAPVGPYTGRHPLPGVERMCEVFSRLGIGPDMQVVVYDDARGGMAARLWWMLRYLGHPAVAVLDGGWQEWARLGLAVENGERHNPAVSFRGEPQPGWLVSAADLAAGVDCLIDARDPARYRGEQEPIDPVAGHIPGAVNYCWQRSLADDGCFRAPDSLQHDLLQVLHGTPPGAAVCYCGSGVTACHVILAAAHAGLSPPRLYAGSWSEWCSRPERPVATGEPG